MDLKKLQKKYNITSQELQKEIHSQADKVIGMLNKEITEPEATERVNNLKDLILRNMQVMGIVDEHTKEEYLPIVFKSVTIVSTSRTIGMFFIVTFLLVNIVEASIGNVAFLDPEIAIVPDIFFPPLISNFCINFKIILLVK